MLNKKYTLHFYFVLIAILCALGFDSNIKNYLYPIEGFYALSGSFGELRSNHFHSGLDIKTGGQIGRRLQAIEDGYVYRIKISPYGYGRAIYIKHIDGNYALYGHLSRFTDSLEAYARAYQFEHQKSSVEIFPKPNELRVKKGEIIGYSGNSGSSLGPHLHFELRDSTERIINPLHYYKRQIADTKPPVVQGIAIEPIGLDGRVDGKFKTKMLPLESGVEDYRVPGIVKISGTVGLRYRAYDLLNAARNHCGINTAKLFLDDSLIYKFDLQSFAFDETRYINVHIDYADKIQRKRSYQRAFKYGENRFSAIEEVSPKGFITLHDNQVHNFRLELSDTHGNQSIVRGKLQKELPKEVDVPYNYSGRPTISHIVKGTILKLNVRNPQKAYQEGISYEDQYGEQHIWKPSYRNGNELVFLFPLDRHHMPRRIFDTSGLLDEQLPHWEPVTPNKTNLIEYGDMQLLFPHESVYEENYLEVGTRTGEDGMLSDIYRIGHITVPVFRRYLFSLMPKDTSLSKYAAVAYLNRDRWSFIGSQKSEDGRIFASTNDFGEFALVLDSIPPTLRPVNFVPGSQVSSNRTQLRLYTEDNFSGINDGAVRGKLDGKWIPFEYDFKRDVIFHRLKERPTPGEHILQMEVSDRVGNKITKTYKLIF